MLAGFSRPRGLAERFEHDKHYCDSLWQEQITIGTKDDTPR
jgi:hypothetical protein